MDGLSVVIPIYNVEKYITQCLTSIVESIGTFTNVQVILVNDGSKDGSGKIAQSFGAQYDLFLYVMKENGGLSDARNFGLKFVKYSYVTFLDSDDYISKDYFREIFNALKSEPDLVIFDWMDVGDDGYTNIVKGIEIPNHLWTVQPSAWNKVYKTSLFNQIEFPKGKIYEDVGTTYKLLSFVENYVYINQPLYKYRKNRQGSILTTISPRINDIYDVLEDTYTFYKRNGTFSKNAEGLCYQYVKILLWPNMYRQLKFYKFNFFGFYKKMKTTRELINHYFADWKDNPYLLTNINYFSNRFGDSYIKKMDRLGEGFLITAITVAFLTIRNIKKR